MYEELTNIICVSEVGSCASADLNILVLAKMNVCLVACGFDIGEGVQPRTAPLVGNGTKLSHCQSWSGENAAKASLMRPAPLGLALWWYSLINLDFI